MSFFSFPFPIDSALSARFFPFFPRNVAEIEFYDGEDARRFTPAGKGFLFLIGIGDQAVLLLPGNESAISTQNFFRRQEDARRLFFPPFSPAGLDIVETAFSFFH